MFIPGAMAAFSQLLSLISTIFMIWMLIDCIRNRSIERKGGWICFIIFTQLIGASVYFFTRGPWPQVRQALFSPRAFPQAAQTPNPQPSPQPEEFPAYEQGYQAQQPIPFQAYAEASEPAALQPEYEQPLLDYPEMPPMEQQQQ